MGVNGIIYEVKFLINFSEIIQPVKAFILPKIFVSYNGKINHNLVPSGSPPRCPDEVNITTFQYKTY